MTTDLDKVRELLEGVTEGPWTAARVGRPYYPDSDTGNEWAVHSERLGRLCELRGPRSTARTSVPADATFIAAARTLVPAMADEIAELRRERDRLASIEIAYTGMIQARDKLSIELNRERSMTASLRDALREAHEKHDHLRATQARLAEALKPFAGLNAEIDWLESVIAAGREMYERAIRDRNSQHEIAQQYARDWYDAKSAIERLRAALEPFAAVYREDMGDDFEDDELLSPELEARHWKRARAALSAAERDAQPTTSRTSATSSSSGATIGGPSFPSERS